MQKLLAARFKELDLSKIIIHNYKPRYVRGDARVTPKAVTSISGMESTSIQVRG